MHSALRPQATTRSCVTWGGARRSKCWIAFALLYADVYIYSARRKGAGCTVEQRCGYTGCRIAWLILLLHHNAVQCKGMFAMQAHLFEALQLVLSLPLNQRRHGRRGLPQVAHFGLETRGGQRLAAHRAGQERASKQA